MRWVILSSLIWLLSLLSLNLNVNAEPHRYTQPNETRCTVSRDVIVVGGGASGTHAAIRLQQLGYTVALIEKTQRLGGHVNTFVDPRTNQTFDHGVLVFDNQTTVREYFSYLDIKTKNDTAHTGVSTLYANFATDGKTLQDGLPSSLPYSNPEALGQTLKKYQSILQQYPYLDVGHDLPDPVPEELLMTWGDFSGKHELGALANFLFSFDQGFGNFLAQPALYIIQSLNKEVVESVLGATSLLRTFPQDNQAIYNSAQRKLGADNVFLDSHVSRIDRSELGEVALTVNTPKGQRGFQGRKLLIAIQPVLSNLQSLGLDLNHEEEGIFKQLNNSYYWTTVIQDSGIPQNTSLVPIDLAAPLGIPSAPTIEGFAPNAVGIPDLTVSYFTSSNYVSDDYVKEQILEKLRKIQRVNGYESTKTPKFVAFENHSPYQVTAPAEAIRDGFYRKMNALQGKRDTFFTGAAWQSEDSSKIWAYNDRIVLPQIEASLKAKNQV